MEDDDVETCLLGGRAVPVLVSDWEGLRGQPYRRTYNLKPGESWFDMTTTSEQTEVYALDGTVGIPVGAMIARELIAQGASWACFTEMWGAGRVLVGPDLVCVEQSGDVAAVMQELHEAVGKWAGLPDVVGRWPDGRIILREAKCTATKDKVSEAQHEFFAALWATMPDRIDAAVVQWGLRLRHSHTSGH